MLVSASSPVPRLSVSVVCVSVAAVFAQSLALSLLVQNFSLQGAGQGFSGVASFLAIPVNMTGRGKNTVKTGRELSGNQSVGFKT